MVDQVAEVSEHNRSILLLVQYGPGDRFREMQNRRGGRKVIDGCRRLNTRLRTPIGTLSMLVGIVMADRAWRRAG
jgi:hypothetical protein